MKDPFAKLIAWLGECGFSFLHFNAAVAALNLVLAGFWAAHIETTVVSVFFAFFFGSAGCFNLVTLLRLAALQRRTDGKRIICKAVLTPREAAQ